MPAPCSGFPATPATRITRTSAHTKARDRLTAVSAANVHIVIPTHTTRHLRACLLGVGRLDPPPCSCTVTVDGKGPEFGELCASIPWPGGVQLMLVERPHRGAAHLNQVRNNGLRALQDTLCPQDEDLTLIIDGDMVLAADAIARHASAAADVILGSRADLNPNQTEQLSAALHGGERDRAEQIISEAWSAHVPEARARQRRLERQLRLRRVPVLSRLLVKAHKPKLLGGHHAVRWSMLERVNGYDERFVGYGFDDDDLARRLYAAGASVCVLVDAIPAVHLYHPTRAPGRPGEAPGYARFCQPWSVRAEMGLDRPDEQPDPALSIIRRAGSASTIDARPT